MHSLLPFAFLFLFVLRLTAIFILALDDQASLFYLGKFILFADSPGGFPGHFPSEGSYYASRMAALHGKSDMLRNDVPLQPRAYGVDGPAAASNPALSGLGGLGAGTSARGPSPLQDPAAVRSSSLGKTASIPDVERPSALLNLDGPREDESNILFVDGLPTDCTRREVAHLFRPFIGFKDIRLVHKEPRHSGDKAYVLCFVEFSDAKCALTAMEALQGYRVDERKPDASVLEIKFARFPFRPPAAAHDDRKRLGAHSR
ncbi:hypothetical protein GUJ93_ZPchr0012g18840 [Zizania palustris]|uniref:RRM domain-containing protein n=1 Tax=Zizania palustris TaxID=103762 RepID=A0A8J5WMD5_ZIZPA|nr:hypothetical protein GUJ93_ZPchr0012g18840 [Zizania palustris]KAG8093947.1 hypothetical protein GUJ93_ZPchr0012g18840 [Zizania palustris]